MYSDIETTAAWRELTIAIVGGDEREQEIARLAIASGARVTAFGFPLPQAPIDGLAVAGSAGEALDG
ncbi:MAG: dipicolinate synthase subunit DpsA, partial [Pseudomonadota bacterium]